MTDIHDGQHRLDPAKNCPSGDARKRAGSRFSAPALAELDGIHGPATQAEGATHDLRNLLWCSIDNDDSRDLDQLTVAEFMPNEAVKVLVAIADVDASSKSIGT